jgi:hypothetical protein
VRPESRYVGRRPTVRAQQAERVRPVIALGHATPSESASSFLSPS